MNFWKNWRFSDGNVPMTWFLARVDKWLWGRDVGANQPFHFPSLKLFGLWSPNKCNHLRFYSPELPILILTWKSRDFLVPFWTFIFFLIIFIKLILGANFLWPFTRGRSYDLKKIIKFLKNILKKIIFIAYLGTIHEN